MSFCNPNYISCEALQAPIENYFSKINPATFVTPAETGFLQYLVSPFNTDGALQNITVSADGKLRTVNVRWSPRISTNDLSRNCGVSCNPTNILGDNEEEYKWNGDCEAYSFIVDPDVLNLRCQENSTWFAEKIAQAMSVIIRGLEVACAARLPLLIGNFAAEEGIDDKIKDTCVEIDSGFAVIPSYRYIQEIEYSTTGMGYPSVPVVIGWGAIWKAFSAHKASCCSYSGINIGDWVAKNGLSIVPSIAVDDVLDGNFITTAAGTMQLLFFPAYRGAKGINVFADDSYKRDVIIDPTFNIPFDYHTHMICENDRDYLAVTLKVPYMLVGYPTDLFCSDDRLYGVTFVNEWNPCGSCGTICYEQPI